MSKQEYRGYRKYLLEETGSIFADLSLDTFSQLFPKINISKHPALSSGQLGIHIHSDKLYRIEFMMYRDTDDTKLIFDREISLNKLNELFAACRAQNLQFKTEDEFE